MRRKIERIVAVPPPLTGNSLLDSFSASTRARLLPMLTLSQFKRGHVISEPCERIDEIAFPIGGVVSTVTRMRDGGSVEVGLTGHDGMSGVSVIFGDRVSPHSTLVQIADGSYTMPAKSLLHELESNAHFKARVRAYAGYSFVAATQFAACNRLHPIEERNARWLLMADDRVGGDPFVLTQEFSAQMLGVRRAGVTVVAGTLSNAGLIAHSRGHVSILDRAGLEDAACECYGAVNAELQRFMGYGPRRVSISSVLGTRRP